MLARTNWIEASIDESCPDLRHMGSDDLQVMAEIHGWTKAKIQIIPAGRWVLKVQISLQVTKKSAAE